METTENETRYGTPSGVVVHRTTTALPYAEGTAAIAAAARALDARCGAVFASGADAPPRYSRWDVAFVDPPLVIEARARSVEVRATCARGLVLLPALVEPIGGSPAVEDVVVLSDRLRVRLAEPDAISSEEDRLAVPTALSVARAVLSALRAAPGEPLCLYGAFGYDLVFDVESVARRRPRDAAQRDLVLFLGDRAVRVDHATRTAVRVEHDFEVRGLGTRGLPRAEVPNPLSLDAAPTTPAAGTDPDGARFRAGVERAREAFARGDLFEVVLSHAFTRPLTVPPSVVFERLRVRNPAPYGAYLSLGRGERLVSASPEMFVRVEGGVVETCPIAGTVRRDGDPLRDAERIAALLASEKDEAELTMCTDVDRNDKARVCVPGSVEVVGRRLVELYAKVIHTVDHVRGRLRPDADAIDALLAHAWAVTVTGAPKPDALQFIEDHEDAPRRFYGGAMGMLGTDGSANTGLTLRTLHVEGAHVSVRAGATLLHASDPDAELRETHDKAAAVLEALEPDPAPRPSIETVPVARTILLVDHRDSFVHTLGDYLRRTGARVVTRRPGFSDAWLDALAPDLVVLSPGPGTPTDHAVHETLARACARGIPVFGVCLGLQGLVESFGGRLDRLAVPAHGRASTVEVHDEGSRLFEGVPRQFRAGRYHSLHARVDAMPDCLRITARTTDGVVMAVEHRDLPLAAVQFHPESILTPVDVGMRLLDNALSGLGRRRDRPRGEPPRAP